MYHDPIDYEGIQRRVVARLQRRYRFFFHTAIFVLGIPVVVGWSTPTVFLLWIGIWLFHLVWMNYQNNVEKAIAEEIEQERGKVIKRKRDMADIEARYEQGEFRKQYDDRPDWLTEDGELVHPDEHDYEEDY